MCFGGKSTPPPPPEPVAPNPPQVSNTTEQDAPEPSEEDNTVSNIQANTQGTSLLTIPLTNTSGSGVQTGNNQ